MFKLLSVQIKITRQGMHESVNGCIAFQGKINTLVGDMPMSRIWGYMGAYVGTDTRLVRNRDRSYADVTKTN